MRGLVSSRFNKTSLIKLIQNLRGWFSSLVIDDEMKSLPLNRDLLIFRDMIYFTYVIYSEKGNIYYKGFTENLEKRLLYHNSGKSTFTSRQSDWKFAYWIAFETKTEALREEKRLKKLNKVSLIKLIANFQGLV